MNQLLKLRDWLTLPEAAAYASKLTGTRIAHKDVLRLGLDRHLQLSAVLPIGAKATQIAPQGAGAWQQPISGLWDLAMTGPEVAELTSDYHYRAGLDYVGFDCSRGALVKEADAVYQVVPLGRGRTGMTPVGPSCFPEGTVIAVRRVAIEELAAKLGTAEPVVRAETETLLGERERATLLSIIYTLADAAKVDLTQTFKAAEQVSAMADRLGISISAQTINGHFKRAAEVAQRRSR